MSYDFVSPTNIYIPNVSAKSNAITADLVVNYSRNVKDFMINKICQLITVKKPIGYYKRVLPENRANVGDGTRREDVWNYGADRPNDPGNRLAYENIPYYLKRYVRNVDFSYEELEFGDIDVKADHIQMLGQQVMTRRTELGLSVLTNTSNYPANHTGTATALGGGLLTAGTINNRIIQKTLMAARNRIIRSTLGMNTANNLAILLNPTLAQALAATEEIMAYKAQQVGSPKELEFAGSNDTFGLPSRLYGFNVLIEQTVENANGPSTTDVSADNNYVMPTDRIVVFYQPGKFVSDLAKGINATLAMFSREEMRVETRDDNWNRNIKFSVTDEYEFQVAAPRTGFVITGCV